MAFIIYDFWLDCIFLTKLICCVIYEIWQFWLWNWDRWYPLSVYLLTQWFYEGVQTTNVQVDKIFNKLHPWMISVTRKDITPVLSFFQRCVHYLLAAFLSDPCTEGPLQKLLHLTLSVQRRYLAGIPQQCRQPCHIHHFQHWISQSLHQDPALLVQKDERCQLSKNKKNKKAWHQFEFWGEKELSKKQR